MVLIAAIFFCIVMGYDLYTDYTLWHTGKIVNHTWGAIIRIAGLLIPLFLLAWSWKKWYAYALSAFMICSVYWLLFDALFNIVRGFPLLANGTTSKIDIILLTIPNFLEALIKLALCVVSIFLYFKYKKRDEKKQLD